MDIRCEKIKIVYLVSTLGKTGPTRQLYNLIKYLDRESFKVDLITLSRSPSSNLETEFNELRIPLHPLNLTRLSSLTTGLRRLRFLLNQLMPDIVHSQGLRADWLTSKLTDYRIRIATQRNNPFDDYPMLYGTLLGRIAAVTHSRALSQLSIVASCSKTIANSRLQKNRRTIVIRNGVDLVNQYLAITSEEKSQKRQMLNLPTAGKIFVYTGPLIDRKDPEFLVRTFLRETHRLDTLCLLGDGPLLSICRNLAQNTSNILLPGSVTNVVDYLHAADFFVSASRSEGMPNAVLEGLATGLPVILSDIPSHREILNLSPAVGALFSPSNQEHFSQQLSQTISTIEIRQAARRLVEQYFNAEKMSNAYEVVYTEALQNAHHTKK